MAVAEAERPARSRKAPPVTELRVFVICQACHRQVEIVCAAGWDVREVLHDCDAMRGFDVTRDTLL